MESKKKLDCSAFFEQPDPKHKHYYNLTEERLNEILDELLEEYKPDFEKSFNDLVVYGKSEIRIDRKRAKGDSKGLLQNN